MNEHTPSLSVEAHLLGEVHLGLYPLLTGDVCHWLAAGVHGAGAMLDAHDAGTGVLGSSLRKRAPGYVSLGFPDPRR